MNYFFLLVCSLIGISASAQKTSLSVKSPDSKLTLSIEIKDKLLFSIMHENDLLVAPSSIALITDADKQGVAPVVRSSKTATVNREIVSPFYKRARIEDHYNELIIAFKNDFSLIVRAYNDGVAYRFSTTRNKDFLVLNEELSINFPSNFNVTVPYVKDERPTLDEQVGNSFENTYTTVPLSEVDPKRLSFLPVLIDAQNGKKICITEADLESYPGMYLVGKGVQSLTGFFARYPKEVKRGGHNQLQELVSERENYIAKSKGTRLFPWRAFIVSMSDKELADNDLVYKLASPSRVSDVSWVKPGKVAWDWWNDWNITGVDFTSGVNTQTYKYYIDFAAQHKIEYVILDEGWAVNLKADLMQVVPEIDLKEIISHANQKNVGIILWAGYNAFNDDMENVCRHYASLGVKGFKIDFMDRDDQAMVDFFYKAASVAAKHKLLVDFHGAYKPTGLHRTFPNVLNFEGVHGLEQMKWSPPSVDQVTYDVTIPFIRMVAGPMDYTPGAMRNASKESYRPVYSEPMSQGTRCHQLAMFVVFHSPLNMLCDAPSNYMKEPETTAFMAAVPTVWDETIVINGEVGKYVSIARRKGDVWYVGSMTNWDARKLTLDLSFLGEGTFQVEAFQDGVNAHRAASDFVRTEYEVTSSKTLNIQLSAGGGFVARLKRQ